MRLIYITRAKVPSKDAQSFQIACMARAYYEALGEEFLLQCGGSNLGIPEVPHKLVSRSARQWQRYFRACANAAQTALTAPEIPVITRDIAVAWTLISLGGQAVFEAHDVPHGRLAKAMMRRCNKSQRFRIVTNCEALACYYRDNYGVPAERLLPLHNGCFVNDYDALRKADKADIRRSLGLPADKIIIVHTGSLYKGGAELFEQAVNWRSNFTEFVHIGGSQIECDTWTNRYRERGLHNIRFLPHRLPNEVRRYQCAADLLFYVSTRNSAIWWCTSPLKIFEYMASGTPILGAALGSLKEVLNESNALLFDPDRPESITTALEDLIAYPEAAAERAARAYAQAQSLYSWNQRARRILEFAHVSPATPSVDEPKALFNAKSRSC